MKFPYKKLSTFDETLTPGFYAIDHDAYHAGPGLSSSKLKLALKSLAEFSRSENYDSDALAFGRAFHMAALEPSLFVTNYVCGPNIPENKNTKSYKEKYAFWEQTMAKGREIIDFDDYQMLQRMLMSYKEHDYLKSLPEFDAEVMAATKCKTTGRLLKCKTDLFGHTILDLKTTRGGVTTTDITRALLDFGYHISAAFYQDILKDLTGETLPFVIALVSKKEPYECEAFQLHDDVLNDGRKLYKAALERIARWQDRMNATGVKIPEVIEPKRLRTLSLSPRIMYSTQETLNFIAGN